MDLILKKIKNMTLCRTYRAQHYYAECYQSKSPKFTTDCKFAMFFKHVTPENKRQTMAITLQNHPTFGEFSAIMPHLQQSPEQVSKTVIGIYRPHIACFIPIEKMPLTMEGFVRKAIEIFREYENQPIVFSRDSH